MEKKRKESIHSFILHDKKAKWNDERSVESFQKLVRTHTRARADGQVHLTNLLINLFEKVHDKVDQPMCVHRLRVEVRHQKADIVVLNKPVRFREHTLHFNTYWYGLATKDMEVVSALHHETHQSLA